MATTPTPTSSRSPTSGTPTGAVIPTTDPSNGVPTTDAATAQQLAVGNNAWIELRVRVQDLVRVGTDPSRTLANIDKAEILVDATGGSGNLTVQYNELYFEGGYGPDVGDVGNPYVYRYRYRSSITGEVSNVSPPNRGGVSPRRQRVKLNAGAQDADAQADLIDWFRYGGSLDRFTYVGSGPNSTAEYDDDYSDDNVSGGVTPTYDDFQPWPTLDLRRTGTCTAAGPALKWISGDTFNLAWAPGSLILINGRACTLDHVLSTTVLLLNESAGSGSPLTFEMPGPEILGQPLPALWGPDNENYFYACGDPNNPGTLYWSQPGSPDLTSDTYSLIVTSGSTVLQSGFVWDGQPFVASSENLYRIVDNPNAPGQKVAQVTAAGRGFWTRWSFCLTPQGVVFLSKDGIYLSAGGTAAQSLTDPDLRNLFPHDGLPGVDVNGVDAPDMTQTTRLRLAYIDGIVYFDYADQDGHDRTLLLVIADQAWLYDLYPLSGVETRIEEKGTGVHDQLMGTVGGFLITYTGVQDRFGPLIMPISVPWAWNSHWEDYGDPRMVKQFGDAVIDADPNGGGVGWTVTPVFDDDRGALTPQTLAQGLNDRQQVEVEINAGAGQLARNMGLLVTGADSCTPVFYLWEPSAVPKVETTGYRATDWDNLGYQGAKFVQGILIRANTFGAAKNVEVQYDGGTVALTLEVVHNGEELIAYPNANGGWTPFVAHLVRLVGADGVPWQLYDSQLQWIFEPAPELATEWSTQSTTHDLPGYFSLRDMLVAYESADQLTLTVAYDGVPQTYTLPSTQSLYHREYIPMQVGKGRSVQYTFTSAAPFRLYKRDMAVRVQGWGIPGGYVIANPFGGPSRISGADI